MAVGAKSERKCYALYIDAAFSADYSATDYKIIGHDLESLSVELNPTVETFRNILGQNGVRHEGYEPSIDVDTFYHRAKETLESKVLELAIARKSGDACKTSCVEVVYEMAEDGVSEPDVIHAYREDILVVPTSYGGDTTGFQTPFQINFSGNRTSGDWDRETSKFTANNAL